LELDMAVQCHDGEAGAAGLGLAFVPPGFVDHLTTDYDRVPKHDVEIRRTSLVLSSDGHRLGHVDGFVVDDEDLISHLVVERRHLWRTRDLAIPLGAIAAIDNDEVRLTLSRHQFDELSAPDPDDVSG
jgi:hypothetical protein